MRIDGIDFTSAPSRAKPLTCASCELQGGQLRLVRLRRWHAFVGLTTWLARPGPWVAGFDFPFGLPEALTQSLALGDDWDSQVRTVAAMERPAWRESLAQFRALRPPGSKEPPRQTDLRVGAQSAMKAVNPPVALMYQCGAAHLLAADLNILPCRPNGSDRTAIETYPALLARQLIGRTPYKHDGAQREDPLRRQQRRVLLDRLIAQAPRHWHLQIQLSSHHRRRLIDDGSGDLLDALLCAVHAAWAWHRPEQCRPPNPTAMIEGWIPWDG